MSFDWGAVVSALCSVILAVLGWLGRRMTRIEEKLDGKLDKAECRDCSAEHKEQFSEVWDALAKHSHTGLETTSRVTR